MEITTQKKECGLILTLTGRLDTTTSPQLEEVFSKLSGENLTVDMKDLEYISSAGLRVLLAQQKKCAKGGSLTLTNLCEEVKEVFDMTGFSDIIKIK